MWIRYISFQVKRDPGNNQINDYERCEYEYDSWIKWLMPHTTWNCRSLLSCHEPHAERGKSPFDCFCLLWHKIIQLLIHLYLYICFALKANKLYWKENYSCWPELLSPTAQHICFFLNTELKKSCTWDPICKYKMQDRNFFNIKSHIFIHCADTFIK